MLTAQAWHDICLMTADKSTGKVAAITAGLGLRVAGQECTYWLIRVLRTVASQTSYLVQTANQFF